MFIKKRKISTIGIKFFIEKDNREVARAFLYLMKNDLHQQPFGLMEDVFIDESLRGKGYGTKIVKELIKEAKKQNCYKLIATSRYARNRVHKLYKELGFQDWGKEFRINLKKE
ncbi:MAG TPA: GNAT family N-acetyltransferase [Bacillota bacterium]|nr:GNAT family N-acetyltransferase [Bacillota bacterium]